MLRTNKTKYMQGEEVEIVLENKSNNNIILPNSAPWKIVNEKGENIYTPLSLQVIVTLNPNEKLTWKWKQKDMTGKQVQREKYYIILETVNMNKLKTKFEIN